MSDVFWAAIISGGSTLAAAVLTNWLALIRANRQADRAERQEALKWERSEARRREEAHAVARQREQERQARDLQQFWAYVEQTHQRMHALLWQWEEGQRNWSSTTAQKMPSHCALRAYSVALRGLAVVYPATHKWFLAVVHQEGEVRHGDAARIADANEKERQAFHHLLKTVARLTGALSVADEAQSGTAALAPSAQAQ